MSDGVSAAEYEGHKDVCGRSFERVFKKLESIDKRLFRDNGNVSIQTRLDRHEQTIRTIKRLTWITVTAVLGILVATVVGVLGKHFG